jgi:hypothetical protein
MTHSSLRCATLSAFASSLTFWLFFQLTKIRAIQAVTPFAHDPYDAVASFAFQIAVLVGLLSLARLVSTRDESSFHPRAKFILRGILLVELTLAVAIVTDFIAIILAWPLTFSAPMIFLLAGLGVVTALFFVTGYLLLRAWREPANLLTEAPADALGQTIRDCWTLVTFIAIWIIIRLPLLKPLWQWVDSTARKLANGWNRRLPFSNPDLHPWQFAVTFAVLAGLVITTAIMVSESIAEGGPASLPILFLLIGIFLGGEIVTILLGFLLFCGYLGLRPKLR